MGAPETKTEELGVLYDQLPKLHILVIRLSAPIAEEASSRHVPGSPWQTLQIDGIVGVRDALRSIR